jgi:hypothetical protein
MTSPHVNREASVLVRGALYDQDMTAGTRPARPASRPLPAGLDYAELRVHSTARLFGTDMDDPGLTRVTGTVCTFDFPNDEEDGKPTAATEGIGLTITRRSDGSDEITILQAEAIVLDLDQVENAYESLDADSQELEAYGCLFDLAAHDELHPDLDDMLQAPIGRHVVIAQRVRIAPAWRGCGGVGRYLAGRLFRLVCSDPIVIATQPFPLDVARDERGNADEAELKPAVEQIQRTWKSIGFQPYKEEIWIMDPSSSSHEQAMARLQRTLGLPGSMS